MTSKADDSQSMVDRFATQRTVVLSSQTADQTFVFLSRIAKKLTERANFMLELDLKDEHLCSAARVGRGSR